MVNIDKNEVNKNINEAYENQTDKVKELFDSAKIKMETQDEEYKFKVNKTAAKKVYNLQRIIEKKKTENKEIEDSLDKKFNNMNDKLDLNSKNLDFIFTTVANKNDKEIELLNEINKSSNEANENNIQMLLEIREILESSLKNIKSFDEEEILLIQKQLESRIIELQEQIGNKVVNSNIRTQREISNIRDSLDRKIKEIQRLNEDNINEIRRELERTYKNNDKTLVKEFMEEKNTYLKELEEKDKQIRELNYKIYKYEDMLEKAEKRKARFNLFAPFYKHETIEEEDEEEPVVTSQILNFRDVRKNLDYC